MSKVTTLAEAVTSITDGSHVALSGFATARCAMVVSSVSPERCHITALKPFSLANLIAAKVWLKVPIWLTLIKMEFAQFCSIPFFSLWVLVTKRSSPTI